jgi:hypothetical protein
MLRDAPLHRLTATAASVRVAASRPRKERLGNDLLGFLKFSRRASSQLVGSATRKDAA